MSCKGWRSSAGSGVSSDIASKVEAGEDRNSEEEGTDVNDEVDCNSNDNERDTGGTSESVDDEDEDDSDRENSELLRRC